MGTDIHALIEVQHEGKDWAPLRGAGMPQQGPRDYVLFSILADSRNHGGRHEPRWQEPQTITDSTGQDHEIPGWWYAPDDGGHDRLEPISLPRGVPDDATLIWKAYVEMWKARGASIDVTWLTPSEILSADWDQEVYSYGVLPEQEYLKLRDEGVIPDLHPANAGGPGVRVVNEVEYAAGERGEQVTCVSARWKSGKARDLIGNFLEVAQELVDIENAGTSKVRFMLLFES
jgi:hypothetical protein